MKQRKFKSDEVRYMMMDFNYMVITSNFLENLEFYTIKGELIKASFISIKVNIGEKKKGLTLNTEIALTEEGQVRVGYVLVATYTGKDKVETSGLVRKDTIHLASLEDVEPAVRVLLQLFLEELTEV